MQSVFLHSSMHVLDLAKSLAFYERALGLKEAARIESPNLTLVYLGDKKTSHHLELTVVKGRKEPYSVGENMTHVAFSVPDFAAAHRLHEEMNCICRENKEMGIYFIRDLDGNWLEILPEDWLKNQDFVQWK